MGTAISFIVLTVSLLLCLFRGLSITYAMLAALVAFMVSGTTKGYTFRQVAGFAIREIPKILGVARVLVFVGFLTGLWRSSGTIAFFLHLGLKYTPPFLFILLAFLLSALLSYLLGSSFAVASTAGVILMAIARSADVNTLIAAGAVLSGIYFGDRGAPTSSAAALVATLTETEIPSNVKAFMKTSVVPYAIAAATYLALSFANPLKAADSEILELLASTFRMNPLVLIPAVLMFILPLLKVRIWVSMAISAAAAFILTVTTQGHGIIQAIGYALLGFQSQELPSLSGGGVKSMLKVVALISTASMLFGALRETKILENAKNSVEKLAVRIGLFPSMFITSLLSAAVICNQTVTTILAYELLVDSYSRENRQHEEMAVDLANSALMLAALIPWSIAVSVPLGILGVGFRAVFFAFSIYLIPLFHLVTKKWFYR